MKKKRFSVEQIVGVLKQAEVVAVTGSFGDWTPITVHLTGEISTRKRTTPYKGGMFAAYSGI